MKLLHYSLLLAATLALAPTSALGADVWNATTGVWNVNANWSLNAPPGITDGAIFSGTTYNSGHLLLGSGGAFIGTLSMPNSKINVLNLQSIQNMGTL